MYKMHHANKSERAEGEISWQFKLENKKQQQHDDDDDEVSKCKKVAVAWGEAQMAQMEAQMLYRRRSNAVYVDLSDRSIENCGNVIELNVETRARDSLVSSLVSRARLAIWLITEFNVVYRSLISFKKNKASDNCTTESWLNSAQTIYIVCCILALAVVTTTKLQFKTHIKLQRSINWRATVYSKKQKNSPSSLMTCNWTSWTVSFIFFHSHLLWRLFKVSSSWLVSGAVAHCKVSYQAGSWLMRTKLQMFKWAEREINVGERDKRARAAVWSV